tara:strand:- start:577 stop:732 length:156 start_codon:yes stop_codon:yes gene_type:complete
MLQPLLFSGERQKQFKLMDFYIHDVIWGINDKFLDDVSLDESNKNKYHEEK